MYRLLAKFELRVANVENEGNDFLMKQHEERKKERKNWRKTKKKILNTKMQQKKTSTKVDRNR